MPRFLNRLSFLQDAWRRYQRRRYGADYVEAELIELDRDLVLCAQRGRNERIRLATRWMSPDSAIFTTLSPLREGEQLKLRLSLDNVTLNIVARVHWTTQTNQGRVGQLELLTPARHRGQVESFLLQRQAESS